MVHYRDIAALSQQEPVGLCFARPLCLLEFWLPMPELSASSSSRGVFPASGVGPGASTEVGPICPTSPAFGRRGVPSATIRCFGEGSEQH
jgi:hypothetical protein